MKLNIKNNVSRIRAVVLTVILLIISIVGNVGNLKVNADAIQIVQDGYARFGGRSCGRFFVNGETAFCMEHIKNSPGTGTIGETYPYDNDLIKTILYYGWGGPENIYTDENEGIVRTSFALNYVYTGDPAETGDASRKSGLELAQPLLDYAQAHLITSRGISFDKTVVKGKILPSGYQQTEEIHIQGDGRNTLTFNVPEGITMHSPTSGFVGNGQVTVKGGDSIFFTADSSAQDFSTGELTGSMDHWQTLLLKTSDPSTQDLAKLWWTDPMYKTSLTVTWADEPEIRTQASDKETGTHQGHATQTVTIKDAVSYTNVIPGKEYTVKGTLRNKETGEPIKVDGQDVTAEKTFSPTEANGTIDLEFTLPGSVLIGKSAVVFEKLIQDGIEVAAHEDLTDADQTVDYPEVKVGTVAHDVETKVNTAFPNKSTVLQDEVSYTNLIPGKQYTVKGTLMDKATGKALQKDGKDITAEKTFTAENANGSVTIEFTLDSSALAGKGLVIFEKLYFNDSEIAAHEDLKDEGQTVAFKNIEIHTTAKDVETQENEAFPNENMVLEDEVTYKNLIPGKQYTVRGTLMDKETGAPLQEDGKDITAETTFTAEKENGSVTMKFTLNGSTLAGKELVVFEKIFYANREIGAHEDINDEGQTVKVKDVDLKTTATDKSTGSHGGYAVGEVTIVDEVQYTNLVIGKEYTVKGTLMDKETGEALLVNEEEVTAEKTFTAEQASGSIELEFTFDGSALRGKEVVAFESLEYGNREIAFHKDITDEGQTVRYHEPEVKTTATDKATGTHQATAKKNTTIVDKVSYNDLVIGAEYTVKGTLMDKATGKALVVDGKEVTAEKTFTAEQADGSIELEFTFDASALAEKSVVVFEKLFHDGREIASHEDLQDEGQTVTFIKEKGSIVTRIPGIVKTGDTTKIAAYVIALVLSISFIFIGWRKKKNAGKRD
jgi:LPXTG-motif cell wall-anchored protein